MEKDDLQAIPIWQRGLGILLLALCFLFWDQDSQHFLHTVVLPLSVVIAALLITRAYLAVAMGSSAIAWLGTNAVTTTIANLYLGFAIVATAITLVLIVQRFRAHMTATHKARWEERWENRSNSKQGD